MAPQGMPKFSPLRSSGLQQPSPVRVDQAHKMGDSRSSFIPIRRNPTKAKPLKIPRSSLPDNIHLIEDDFTISGLALSVAMHGGKEGANARHKTCDNVRDKLSPISNRLETRRPLQQRFNPSRNSNVSDKKSVKAEPSTPEQHHTTFPRKCESKYPSKIPLRQTKSAQPTIQIPCAIIVNPRDHVSASGVETAALARTPRRRAPSSDLSSTSQDRASQETEISCPETPSSEISSLIYSLEHFSFFCLLDPASTEKPIACASNFPWNSIQLQEKLDQFFLSALKQEGKVCEIIADKGLDGHENSYLALVDNLPAVSPGNQNYCLACVVDVSLFIDAAIPGEQELQVPGGSPTRTNSLKPMERPVLPVASSNEADKLSAAYRNNGGARYKTLIARRERRALRLKHYLARNTPTSAADDLVDRTVAEFTEKLLEFYTDYFMLARPSSDNEYYEMSHVSESIHKRNEHVDGHLTHSSREVFYQVRRGLGRDDRFTIRVRWGHQAVEKRLYCIPLNDSKSEGWICLLVDPKVPLLWQTSYRGYFG